MHAKFPPILTNNLMMYIKPSNYSSTTHQVTNQWCTDKFQLDSHKFLFIFCFEKKLGFHKITMLAPCSWLSLPRRMIHCAQQSPESIQSKRTPLKPSLMVKILHPEPSCLTHFWCNHHTPNPTADLTPNFFIQLKNKPT